MKNHSYVPRPAADCQISARQDEPVVIAAVVCTASRWTTVGFAGNYVGLTRLRSQSAEPAETAIAASRPALTRAVMAQPLGTVRTGGSGRSV